MGHGCEATANHNHPSLIISIPYILISSVVALRYDCLLSKFLRVPATIFDNIDHGLTDDNIPLYSPHCRGQNIRYSGHFHTRLELLGNTSIIWFENSRNVVISEDGHPHVRHVSVFCPYITKLHHSIMIR